MKNLFKKEINFWVSLASVFVLAIITVATSTIIRNRSLAPERPEAVVNCVLTYSIPTPTPTITPTPRPTLTLTPTPPMSTSTPTITPTPRLTLTLTPTPPSTSTPTVTPTTAPVGQCLDVRIYSSAWTLLTTSQISSLRAGNQVNFCIRGSIVPNVGRFDYARFTINGTQYANTTLLRPGTTAEFCQSYTIPSSVYNFSVVGAIHHTILGWIQ